MAAPGRRLRLVACAIAVMTAVVLLGTPTAAHASTMRFVSTAGFDGNNPCVAKLFPCRTISHALAKAAAGDVISVAAGTYHEHFTIGKDISIVGAGQSKTVIAGHSECCDPPYRMIFVKSHTHVTLSHLTITGGYLNNDVGAGILNRGNLSLDDAAIKGNGIGYTTPGEGGGVYNDHGATLNIESSLIKQNSARDQGGGIYSAGRLVMANSQVKSNFLFTGGLGGGLADVGGGTAVLTDDTFDSDEADKGGGIYAFNAGLTLTRVTLKANYASRMGGGLYNELGTAKLTDVTITHNSAYSGKGSAKGGGIFNVSSARLTLNRVTIDHNSADYVGGGLFNADKKGELAYPVTLTNVTFYSNSDNLRIGEDIYNSGRGYVTLKNVTIFEDSNNYTGQAIFNSRGTLSLKNSIVSTFPANGACQGTITSLGHNLADQTCGLDPTKHDRINANPKLGAFGNHGGFTKTFPLKDGSPAIDHGTNNGCPPTDQRGVARPQDGDNDGIATCDIGAYEARAHSGDTD